MSAIISRTYLDSQWIQIYQCGLVGLLVGIRQTHLGQLQGCRGRQLHRFGLIPWRCPILRSSCGGLRYRPTPWMSGRPNNGFGLRALRFDIKGEALPLLRDFLQVVPGSISELLIYSGLLRLNWGIIFKCSLLLGVLLAWFQMELIYSVLRIDRRKVYLMSILQLT